MLIKVGEYREYPIFYDLKGRLFELHDKLTQTKVLAYSATQLAVESFADKLDRVQDTIPAVDFDDAQTKSLIRDDTENLEILCRWCLAIDLHRVTAKIVAEHNYTDSTFFHVKCDRCGGEFTYYIRGWGADYIKDRIKRLHPRLERPITDDIIEKINNRLWPEFEGDC